MKRLSRSDSSRMVASSSALALSLSASDRSRSVPAAPRIAASGVRRSCEIEVSSAERSRSVSTPRLTRSDVLDEVHALDRERRLVDERVEQPALLGREQRAGLVAVEADDADGAAAGAHRQEQPLGARQRVGAAAGGAIVLPGPFRGGEIGVVERVLRRIAGS